MKLSSIAVLIVTLSIILIACSGEPAPETTSDQDVMPASNQEQAVDVEVPVAPEEAVPILVESDHNGFNIVAYKDEYYAVSQSLGPVDLTQQDQQTLNDYQTQGLILTAATLDEAKLQAGQAVQFQPVPVLVETDYKGFNIVAYQDKFYAVSQALGPVDLMQLDPQAVTEYQEQNQLFIGGTLDETKTLVTQPVEFQPVPILVETDYRGFNIVHYEDKFYAVAHTLGPTDLSTLDKDILKSYQEHKALFIGISIDEAKSLIDLNVQ